MLQPDEPLPVNELGGAYFRDPEGNKICVACHTPEPDPA